MKKIIKELFFFGISGVVGYFVDVFFTSLFSKTLGVYFGRIPGFIMATIATWLINRQLTFKNYSSSHDKIWQEYLHYLSLMIAGAVVNYTFYSISITYLKNISHRFYICIAIGSIAGMGVNYISSKKFLFKNKK